MKTLKTPKEQRSKTEQYFRDKAAENWRYSRASKYEAGLFLGHFGGKFYAFRIAAEKVALDKQAENLVGFLLDKSFKKMREDVMSFDQPDK